MAIRNYCRNDYYLKQFWPIGIKQDAKLLWDCATEVGGIQILPDKY